MTCRRLLSITDWRSQHCLRSLFLLFVAAESSGKEGGGGPGPAESVLIGTFTQECQWGEGSSIGGTEKSPAPSKRLATRATRLKTAGIQTYLLTWVPTGHARALPLGAVEADNSWYPNLSTGRHFAEHSPFNRVSAVRSSFTRALDSSLGTLPHNLTAILGEGHRGHYKYPSNLVGGYKNAALLVFLPSFSSADSQNRLSGNEGRDVLGGNKRVLPPILSCGVAFPSQMWRAGSNTFKRNHATTAAQRAANVGGGHTIGCAETGLYRGCLLALPRLGTSVSLLATGSMCTRRR